MAEQERKTKAERRAEARVERKAAEEAAAAKAKRDSMRNMAVTLLVVVVVGFFVVTGLSSLFGGDGGDGDGAARVISQADAIEARQSAGCEVLTDKEPLEDNHHESIATSPAADVLYASVANRPTHSGPHFETWSDPFGGAPSTPSDERSLTHNLEHGSVIVWFEDGSDVPVNDIENWMRSRQDMGFNSSTRGGNVFTSPYSGITSGKPLAFRAWGVAIDCDTWDETVADSILIDYWGTHGIGPERSFSPYPVSALGYGDATVEDSTDDPADGRHETDSEGDPVPVEASDAATDAVSETESEAATDAATDAVSEAESTDESS